MLSEEKIREKLDETIQDKDQLKAEIQLCTENVEREAIKLDIAKCNAKIDLLREILNG